MFIATAIVSVLLAAVLTASVVGKLRKEANVIAIMTKIEVPPGKVPLLAVAELAGAAGLVIGLFWSPIGVAAAIGVIVYFVGAVGAHLRVGDRRIEAAASLLLIAIVALILRIATS